MPAAVVAEPPLPTQTRIRGDETEDFHPSWTTNSLTGKKEHGVMIAQERSHEGRILPFSYRNRSDFPRPLRPYRLTPIMHRHKMHYIAHADTTRAVPEKPRDQTGAPRTRIGVQPAAPLADPN